MTGWTQPAEPGPGAAAERGAQPRRAARLAMAALLATGALACAPSGTDAGKLPPNVPDPSTVQTPAGALAFYRSVLTLLPPTLDWYVTVTGVFTDELAGLPAPSGTSGAWTALDSRYTAETGLAGHTTDFYSRFHRLRAQAREARGFLAAYALPPDSTDAYNARDLQAQLFALEGYAEVFLADLYCSGIPLSTVDFQGDYTLTPGFTTKEVYLHAAGLFDSALALVSDSSARFGPLAAVGKGRALLGAGPEYFAAAAAAVAGVPEGYRYQVLDEGTSADEDFDSRIVRIFASEYAKLDNNGTPYPGTRNTPGMGDGEGGGLPYVSSHDPRTPYTELGPGPFGGTMYFPTTYGLDGPVTLVLAGSVEARLIEAEAALRAGDAGTWLATLNALRQTALPGTVLPDTTDPGTPPQARVDLLFRERAFWLYLSGHRQGDLRRLSRQYGRDPNTVYPSGQYHGGLGQYGQTLVVPVPVEEQRLNPQYSGCRHLQP